MGPFPVCLPQRAHRYWSLSYTTLLVSWEGPVLLGYPFLVMEAFLAKQSIQ